MDTHSERRRYLNTRVRFVFYLTHTLFARVQGYPFPLSITMVHLIVKFIIAWIVRKLTSLVTGRTPLVLGWREYVTHISPIGEFRDTPPTAPPTPPLAPHTKILSAVVRVWVWGLDGLAGRWLSFSGCGVLAGLAGD